MAGDLACVLDAVLYEFISGNFLTCPEGRIRKEVLITGNAGSVLILKHAVWNLLNETCLIDEYILH